MKKYTITGKNVFRDNQEGIFYVDLNSGMRITVENNPEIMAAIAWNDAGISDKSIFLQKHGVIDIDYLSYGFRFLPNEIKNALIEYQKSKMEIKP